MDDDYDYITVPSVGIFPSCLMTGQPSILGGSWVIISGVLNRVTIFMTHIWGLIAPLITTHEPPSNPPSLHCACSFWKRRRLPRHQPKFGAAMPSKLKPEFLGFFSILPSKDEAAFLGLGFRVLLRSSSGSRALALSPLVMLQAAPARPVARSSSHSSRRPASRKTTWR